MKVIEKALRLFENIVKTSAASCQTFTFLNFEKKKVKSFLLFNEEK